MRMLNKLASIIKATTLIVTILLATNISVAEAGTETWQTVASGCVLDADSVANGRAVQYPQDGSVQFAAGKTGTIYLTCPVSTYACAGGGVSDLYVSAQGGVSGHAYVQGVFNALPVATSGTGFNVHSTLQYTTLTKGSTGGNFTYTPTLGYFYWVAVVMYRDSTAYSPVAWGATFGC